MSDRTSFYYDPIRQGYDTNSWRTLSGAPAIIAGGRLSVDSGSAIHYADLLKGDISFNVNVPTAPGVAESRSFGLYAPNTSAYILFSIGSTLVCTTSDGVTSTSSSTIAWDPAWTGNNIIFRIRWESGRVIFVINHTRVYTVADASVPPGPLSLYLQDDSTTPMSFGDMNVRGTQSFVMNPKTSDNTSFDGLLFTSQLVTVAENLNLLLVNLSLPYNNGNLFDSVSVSENISIFGSLPLTSDSVTVSESVTIVIPTLKPSIFDAVTTAENIALVRI